MDAEDYAILMAGRKEIQNHQSKVFNRDREMLTVGTLVYTLEEV